MKEELHRTQSRFPKCQYSTPRLRKFGKLSELVSATSTGSGTDGGIDSSTF